MAFDAAFEELAVVNTDAGTISVIDERSHEVQDWVGDQPASHARGLPTSLVYAPSVLSRKSNAAMTDGRSFKR